MSKRTIVLALALVVALALPAVAEVEEITVGGNIQIRGQVQSPGIGEQPSTTIIIDPLTSVSVGKRPASFNDDVESLDWISQRTRVNVDAKLSGGVRGFVELQAFDFWGAELDEAGTEAGNDFLETHLIRDELGFGGFAGQGNDEVSLYQSYIEMNDIGDYPFMVRVGRQELVYGREWLIGNNSAGVNFSGLAFDALKVSYDDDMFAIDAWASKLADFSSPLAVGTGIEEDADIDFYGAYGTYKGIENMAIDLYALLVRDAQSNDAVLGTNDTSDVMTLWTLGGRVAGAWDVMGMLPGMLDYNVEAAFQFGDNNLSSALDPRDSGEFGGWAFNAMAGYTFTDVQWTPRLEAEYAFFSGDDDATDEDTEEFVRLFSDVHYGELNLGGDLDQFATNLHIIRVGASAVPVDKLTLKADLLWFMLAEDDEDGLAKTFGLPQFKPVLGVGNVANDDDDAGVELDLVADYQYTEDLNLRAGWAHFFADDAIENSWGAGEDDDVDYVYVQAMLVF